MWKLQRDQQKFLNLDPITMSEDKKYGIAKDLLLGLYEKIAKLAKNSTHYKLHVLKPPNVDRLNIIDSVVDIIKYTFIISQLYGIGIDEIYKGFIRKTEVIYDKTIGERLKFNRNSNVVAVDIDNVIADLSVWGESLKKAKDGWPDGMEDKMIDVIESMKTIFYKEGGLLKLEPIDGSIEGLKKIKSNGWIIVLITARPCWQYKIIRSDTIRWLKYHDIKYDLLLFNKDKSEAIRERIFPGKVSYLIEDKEKHAIEVSEIGIRTLLLSNFNNELVKESGYIKKVENWQQIVEIIGEPK